MSSVHRSPANLLTVSTLSDLSRRQIDDIFSYFPRKKALIFHARDNLHKISKSIFWEKSEKNVLKCRLLKFLPIMLSVQADNVLARAI